MRKPTATEVQMAYDNTVAAMRQKVRRQIRDIVTEHANAMANELADVILGAAVPPTLKREVEGRKP